MPLDPTQTLVDAVWTSLLARSDFTSAVKPGNRIRTSEASYLAVLGSRQSPADFPCVFVFGAGDSVSTPQRSFGVGLPINTFDYPKRIPATLDVRCVFDRLHDDVTMPLEAEIAAALLELDITLHSSPIRPAPMDWRRTRINQAFNGILRTVVNWSTTTECRPYLSDLIA